MFVGYMYSAYAMYIVRFLIHQGVNKKKTAARMCKFGALFFVPAYFIMLLILIHRTFCSEGCLLDSCENIDHCFMK